MRQSNRATKTEAIRLIKRAVERGWERKAEAIRIDGKSISTMVSLTICNRMSDHVHIIFTFRRIARGYSVCVVTWMGTGAHFAPARRGPWSACYHITNFRYDTKEN